MHQFELDLYLSELIKSSSIFIHPTEELSSAKQDIYKLALSSKTDCCSLPIVYMLEYAIASLFFSFLYDNNFSFFLFCF